MTVVMGVPDRPGGVAGATPYLLLSVPRVVSLTPVVWILAGRVGPDSDPLDRRLVARVPPLPLVCSAPCSSAF